MRIPIKVPHKQLAAGKKDKRLTTMATSRKLGSFGTKLVRVASQIPKGSPFQKGGAK